MKIVIRKKLTKTSDPLAKREWRKDDIEHYGRSFPISFWSQKFEVYVKDGRKIVGRATLRMRGGVGEVHQFLIARTYRRKGVGTLLMKKVETIARSKKAHKLFLDTGKGWAAEDFYKKLGFRETGILRDHFCRRDFVLLTKQLKKK